jgi:hypothetical protein
MKDLEGRLEVFETTALLQMLNQSRVTGRLQLTRKVNRASLYFDIGNLTFADIVKRPAMLGEHLVREGALDRATLDRFLRARQPEKKLGRRLVQAGVVSEEAVREAVESQIREVVYEILGWGEGRFLFRSGERPEGEDIHISVSLDHLMLEGVRRIDESRL